MDPYLFKWEPDLSERLYDPLDSPRQYISRLSVPPTVMILHMPIAEMSYVQQKVIWLLVQWAALAGAVSIFFKMSRSRAKAYLTLGISFFLPAACFGVST